MSAGGYTDCFSITFTPIGLIESHWVLMAAEKHVP
jgi:hypothetical protein